MFGVAITPGLLVGTTAASTLELTGSVRLLAIVVGLLAAAATIVGVIYGAKWKSAHAVEKALNDALAERVNLVVHERDEAREKLEKATAVLVDAQATIARLEGLPNLERVLELIGDTFSRLATRLEDLHREHETRAQARHRELLAANRPAD
jgi:hypothetical protein